LKSGDVIVGFDGKPVESPTVLRNVVAQTAVGKTVKVDVLRDKKRRSVNVRIVEQPKEIAQAGTDDETPGSETGGETALSGLEARNLTPDIAQQLGLPATVAGVVITGVSPDSAAADAGVQPGDVVLEVNRKVVRSVTDLKRINGKLSKSESVLLLINRRGGKLFLAIKPS
jgi:serine protease Do